jgi:hypothetical protein
MITRPAMNPLEKLFRLEIEYFRQDREAGYPPDGDGIHTSYALQEGYEGLLKSIPRATTIDDLVRLSNRFGLKSDPRDVIRARDSITRILGLDAYLAGAADWNGRRPTDMI